VALRRIIKKPIVLFAYGEELTKLGVDNLHGGWLRYTIKRSAAIISVSDYTSGLLVNLGADEKIIHKVLPSVGVKKIQRYSDNQLTEFRKELGLENKTVILTVSRLERRKNHELVIRTLPLIIESIPNVIYVIVGGGKLKVELEKLVEELNLVNNVKFAGEIDDELLTRYYKIAKLFILPHIELPETHDTEGCPTVFFEACANGVPVISGQAGGVKDVIRDGYNGLTVSGKSTFELKSKVFEILLNTEIQLKLIRNGYEMVKYNTPEKNAEKITKICENLYY
jgi:phosphatidylinositol alpha-1,6-mannosyltransferase